MVDDVRIFVDRLIQTKLDCGKTIIELTSYDGIEFWWFMDNVFYLSIKDLVLKTRKKERDIGFIMRFYETLGFLLDFIMLYLTRFLFKVYKTKKNNGNIVLFLAHDKRWRTIKDYKNGSFKKSDVFFDSIIQKLIDNNIGKPLGISFLNYLLVGEFLTNLKVFIHKLKNWYIPSTSLEYYWSPTVWKKERDAIKHFKKNWKILKDDQVLYELCKYDGYDFFNNVIRLLKKRFNLFPFALKYVELGREVVRRENLKIVVVLNEYNLYERSIITAAKLEKIPSVAIQHGVITPTHYGYIYHSKDKGRIPLPDITCVFGAYQFHLLTEKSIYPSSQVFITGSPRYDILFNASRIYNKEDFRNKSTIEKDNKIVLWTTQCHGLSYQENIETLSAVFNTIKTLTNTILIIKQHPNERNHHENMIKEFIKKYAVNNVILVSKKSDTFELEYVCDLMITKTSTTAMEAIAQNKPVIVLNLSGEPDSVEYVEEGVAVGVYKSEDLSKVINNLLLDDSTLKKNRKRYISKYLYNIDGSASERVVKLIKKILREIR